VNPEDIVIRGPGGKRPAKTFASETRRIIRSFEGKEFRAIHIISILRGTKIEHLKCRSDSALRAGVRKQLAKLIDRGLVEVIRQPKNGNGEKVAGIYKEKEHAEK
jgi:hypothetical protein